MQEAAQKSAVTVVNSRIEQLAKSLGSLPLAADFAAQMTPVVPVSDEEAFRAYLWTAAVCHATKGGLTGTFGRNRFKGWDFLLRAFSAQAAADADVLSPQNMTDFTADGLHRILTSHSTNTQVNLTDLERRAAILRTTAEELLQKFDGRVMTLLGRADQRAGGQDGAYALLEQLSAFQDPLQKKSSAFLMTVHFSKRWTIQDQESIQPMIDYHRMRVLLRTGCIEIDNPQTAERLRAQLPVEPELEREIRQTSLDVCSRLPRLADMPMFDFDVLLWAHARSCCRHEPMCVSRKAENDSFGSYLDIVDTKRCVFEEWCPGSAKAETRAYWEPIVATENY
ncbi:MULTISPECIES: queuosine salvage family protein [Streptomyces]|uniref:queuosine salvage family protein n=1 Tax=Streptomyces TaxID=1883 RepID=UPI001165141A|nr:MULTISPECIES: queuosine salvage family protein [unclassified Streptomyces]NMI61837.1 hypothetical protein [Streptomyces sp. RLA2-12]QDN60905.1 hypothetical protein FNV67_41430 [Streptomyces sp. S1D4-20]QDN70958.1 hypothetical protein FNV66_40280 [Streptomyces sp. S1D4-14]QDO53414.1 hypothetical protein FNV60_38760 [Streptomyces sp. RLB3-5]QDO63659.1 hypothetical protein FNV59_41010 [Streptomyces sp. RLB1-8]